MRRIVLTSILGLFCAGCGGEQPPVAQKTAALDVRDTYDVLLDGTPAGAWRIRDSVRATNVAGAPVCRYTVEWRPEGGGRPAVCRLDERVPAGTACRQARFSALSTLVVKADGPAGEVLDVFGQRYTPQSITLSEQTSGVLKGLIPDAGGSNTSVTITPRTGDGTGNPGVVPSQARVHHKSYGQWSAAWSLWAFGIPLSQHPLEDHNDCSFGQSGPVWFLGGGLSGAGLGVTRACTVPRGTFLFVPLFNAEAVRFAGGPDGSEAELRASPAGLMNGASRLAAEIDGIRVRDLASCCREGTSPYRIQSPLFPFGPLQDNSVVRLLSEDLPRDGVTGEAVADGVALMLRPLSPGTHTIRISGQGPEFLTQGSIDVTYHLTVPRGPDDDDDDHR